MQSDLAGRVRNTKLATKNALLPVFEAIANSIDAIEERKAKDGSIVVTIERAEGLFQPKADEPNLLSEIRAIAVTDNGIGFTKKNFDSFDTLDSAAKEKHGGKGVGRLVWLVAFEHAVVESVFADGKDWSRRTFDFRRTRNGVEGAKETRLTAPANGPTTTVRLVGFRDPFRSTAPKTALPIARRIIEHFLVRYMLDCMPRIEVRDPAVAASLDLSAMYQNEFKKAASERDFTVGGETFHITHMLLRATSEADNALHFCANQRVVKSQRLGTALPHADGPFKADGEEVLYAACVTGGLLDRSVDAQRTDFTIDHDGDLRLAASPLTWEQLSSGALKAAKEFLIPHLKEAREKSVARIRRFVDEQEPRYRVLLEHRATDIADIPSTLNEDKLELELHKRLADWQHEVKVKAAKNLKAVPDDPESFARFKERAAKSLGELQEVSKSELAVYVVHRRIVLDFFEKLLGRQVDGKFALEEALHSLFFPVKKSSDAVDFEEHNLWLLDERLAFHHFLASDLPFTAHSGAPVDVQIDRRPDILIYNRKMAFVAEDARPFSSVGIIEFKRPERADYTDEKNPVAQVYDYVRDIRAGRTKHANDSTLDRLEESVPFFCHIVVTLNDKLRRQLEDLDFTPGNDGQSYFAYNKSLRAYVEVSSYSRVLHDAMRRNKAFFHKLGLPTRVGRG